MENVENKILNYAKKCGRGKVFFIDDFTRYGSSESVRKALSKLVNDGIFLRAARGIYCYPKIDKLFGFGAMYPTIDEIAQAVAKRDKARLVPTGSHAMNLLGLSTQVPMNFVYLTDGAARTIEIKDGHGIKFVRTVPKNLSFKNRLAMLITFALKEIGENNLTEWQKKRVKELLLQEDKESIMLDLPLMPEWIRTIIRNAYE